MKFKDAFKETNEIWLIMIGLTAILGGIPALVVWVAVNFGVIPCLSVVAILCYFGTLMVKWLDIGSGE